MKIPEHFCQKILCFLILCPKPMDFSMGTENFENENSCKFLSKQFVFFQNQWTFQWGLKILKMKIPEHFCQKILCFLILCPKPMDFSMGTENFENENSCTFLSKQFVFFQNQWTFEWEVSGNDRFSSRSPLWQILPKKSEKSRKIFEKKSKNFQKIYKKWGQNFQKSR